MLRNHGAGNTGTGNRRSRAATTRSIHAAHRLIQTAHRIRQIDHSPTGDVRQWVHRARIGWNRRRTIGRRRHRAETAARCTKRNHGQNDQGRESHGGRTRRGGGPNRRTVRWRVVIGSGEPRQSQSSRREDRPQTHWPTTAWRTREVSDRKMLRPPENSPFHESPVRVQPPAPDSFGILSSLKSILVRSCPHSPVAGKLSCLRRPVIPAERFINRFWFGMCCGCWPWKPGKPS